MTTIVIVAPHKEWNRIHPQLEPILTKIGCTSITAREAHRRERQDFHLIVEGLTPTIEAALLDAFLGFEPVVSITEKGSESW